MYSVTGNTKKISVLFFFFLLITITGLGARTITVNPESDVVDTLRYKTLDAALIYIKNFHTTLDTILFTETNQLHTLPMTEFVSEYNGKLYFIGKRNNPDSFPTIDHSGADKHYNLFQNKNVFFEKVILTGVTNFECLHYTAQNGSVSFKNCVIKNTGSKFFIFRGNATPSIEFENCLFTNAKDTLFRFDYWEGGYPKLKITNCTFDSCVAILNSPNPYNKDSTAIKNCIFSNITYPISDVTITPKITYSLFNAALWSGSGAGCIANGNPGYLKTSRLQPSDWKITSVSGAIDIIDTNSAPKTDIGNQSRKVGGKADLGCWELQNHAPTGIIPASFSINENAPVNTVVGVLKTIDIDTSTGDHFTYSFSSSGTSDNASFKLSGDTLKVAYSPNYEAKAALSARIKSTDALGDSIVVSLVVNITDVNEAPYEINLDSTSIFENSAIKTFIGKLTSKDFDDLTGFVYSLSGTDASSFLISNDSLFSNAAFNYEQKKTYSISVGSTDKAGAGLSYTQNFIISVKNVNEPPTSITLSGSGVKSPGKSDTLVGTFTTIDPDSNSTFTYTLATGDGSTNNGLFTIVGSQLRTLTSIPAGDSLSIRVRSNDGASFFEQKFTIYITTAPVITAQPQSITVFRGSNAQCSVTVAGKELKYQWYKNSLIMTNDTLPRLSRLNCQRADSGSVFYCTISNIAGTVNSLPCTLFVNTKAYITHQPVLDSVSEGDSAIFSVTADGSNIVSYQWFRNDTLLSSEITSSIKIKNVTIAADSGDHYSCKVTNTFGSDSSVAALLIVNKAIPKVTTNPQPATVLDGGTAVFTCVSSGTKPVSYFWFSTKSSTDTLSKKDTLILSAVQKADSGTGYYCIVENSVGKVTSATATLHVGNVKPIVSTNTPDSIVLYEKTSTYITLHSAGTAPLTYQWYKKGATSAQAVGTDNDTLILTNVARTDSGSIYFCIITNNAGADTSNLTKLIVKKALEKPSFPDAIQLPGILTKYVADSLILSVRATGNPLPEYKWMKNDTVISGASDSVLIIPYLTMEYNSAKFFCIVSNSQDTINSDTLTLTVETRPKAQFAYGPSSGLSPLTVAFNDSSTGTITSRLWDFGDGTTSTLANPTHQYTSEKQYTVKLKVNGPGGVDSIVKEKCIYVYKKGSNPIKITGQFLKPSRIILTLTNLSDIDVTNPIFKTDSIGIWFKEDSLPSSPQNSIRSKVLIANKLVTYASYKDTINVPVGDSVYGVMTCLYMANKTISDFSPANGCLVLMRDTMTPVNTLTAIGRHLGGPDVSIDIHNLSSIDTSTIDSVAIWYGYDTLNASFSSSPSVWYSSKFLKLQPSDIYTFSVNNQIFLAQKQVWVGVMVKAQNKKVSSVKYVSFTPGESKANPVILSVAAINAGSVMLKWPHLIDTSFSKIRIWYGKKAVPLVVNVTDQTFDSTTVQSSIDSLVIQSFTAKTQYHFGAQALVKSAASSYWTEITQRASGSVTTPVATDLFPNKLKFTAPVRYDSLSNTIKVYFKLDSTFAANDTMNVGITYSYDSVQVFDYVTINKNGKFPDSSALTFKVPALQFEKKYWVGLWLTKKGSGYWAPPTNDCLGTCSIPSFTRQVVTYFEPGKDTIFANNAKIRLWTDISDNSTTDTLKINSVTSLKGFIVVNPGFYFAKKENTRGFYVGLSYASLPSNYKYSQIRFFRGSDGFASVDTNPPAYDTLNKFVYIKTNDLNDPFMLLIDTLAPTVIAPSKTITAAYQKSDIQESFKVSDNTNNVKWSYFYSAADGKGKTIEGYFNASLKDTSKTITIPKENVGNETGVRIILTVTDGTYTVTYNLSRRIIVTESDGFYLNPQKWTPVSTNFELDETSVSELILKKLKSSDSLYDRKYTRIFQWLPTLKNIASADKWVEYSDNDTSLFKLTPGKTIWLKTRLEKIPSSTGNFVTFSGAKTISLRDTFLLKLKPNSFTDISVPFHFSVRLSDVLNATQKNDSLSFYIWQKEGKDSIYNAKAFYLKNITGANNKDTMVDFQKPLTIMNNSKDTITLRFPPVSYYESPVSLAKPYINPQAWSVTVKAESGNSESEVYYGYVPGEKSVLYPDAPTFLQKRITLLERTSQQQGCYMVTGALPNGGFSKEISLVNKSDSAATFILTAEKNGNFPADYKTVFFNRSSNEFSSTPSVSVAAHSTETIWVISATNSYIENYFNKVMALTYALGSLYPNPCRGVLNIPYVIPFGTSDQISFEIFDELGRLVWKKDLDVHHSGMNRLLWDGKGRTGQKLCAGFYLMRFTSRSGSGKVTSQFHSKFTYLP